MDLGKVYGLDLTKFVKDAENAKLQADKTSSADKPNGAQGTQGEKTTNAKGSIFSVEDTNGSKKVSDNKSLADNELDVPSSNIFLQFEDANKKAEKQIKTLPTSEQIAKIVGNDQDKYDKVSEQRDEDAKQIVIHSFQKEDGTLDPDVVRYAANNLALVDPKVRPNFIHACSTKEFSDILTGPEYESMIHFLDTDEATAEDIMAAAHVVLNSPFVSRDKKIAFCERYKDRAPIVEQHLSKQSPLEKNRVAKNFAHWDIRTLDSKNKKDIVETNRRIVEQTDNNSGATEIYIKECTCSVNYQDEDYQCIFAADIKNFKKAEHQRCCYHSMENSEHTTAKTFDVLTKDIHNLHKDAQLDCFSTLNSSDKLKETHRQELARQLPLLCQHVQKEAVQLFLTETRNIQNAQVMNTFIEQIANLKVDKNEILNQVEKLKDVAKEVVEKIKDAIQTQIEKEIKDSSSDSGSASSFTEIVKSVLDKVSSVVTKCVELNQYVDNNQKPTISEFVEMLEKEVFTAEDVANAGYKDVLITQFSSLNSDTQKAVLKTLTVEDKLMMRKKGLLPRRFWEQVDELASNKVLKGGHVSTSDAVYLARTASNSILYRCLTDSNIKLAEADKHLFEKTLIENRYLKNINGQYQIA